MNRKIWLLLATVSTISTSVLAGDPEVTKYEYDALGRLITVTKDDSASGSHIIQYDAAGNRTNFSATAPIPYGGGVSFSINDKSATEGGNLVFTVTKSGSVAGALTINYATATGTAGSSDFTTKSGTLSFGAAETSKTVSIASTQDTIDEPNETFTVNLTNPEGAATISDSQGVGTIVDDDSPLGTGVSFSINNKSAIEGGSLVFTVTKSGTATGALTINYATATGTAGSSDFTAKSGTLSFGTSETSKTISVASTQDTIEENDETFTVNLSSAQGASTISDSQGVGTIIDDDDPPSFSISDASVFEGGTLTFTVTKAGNTSGTYTIAYATAGGSATSGTDFTAGSGTLTFTTSNATQTITVSTTNDNQYEGGVGTYETMYVNLSSASGGATITDAQGAGSIQDNDENPLCESKPWLC